MKLLQEIGEMTNMKTEQKIPKGWHVDEFGKLALLSKKKYIPSPNEHIKCIELEHFEKETGQLNGYIDSAQQSSTKNYFKKGDVLYGKLRPYLKKYTLASFDGVCSTEIWVLQGCKEKLTNSYLYLIIQSNKFNVVCNVSTGTHMPRADWEYVSNIPFIFPSLPEQEKIAEILSCWDDGIEKLSALIEKKKIQKKALMQQLLTGKHRLKGFSTPWHEVRLGDIGMISSAGVDKKIVEGEKLVNLLNYMDVYKKDFLYASDTSMTVSAPERQIQNCNLKKGDIFFTPSSETRDDIAHSAVVIEDIANGVYSYHIVRLRPTTPIDLKFSAYAFKTNHFYKQAFSICEGSGQRYVISQDDFRNMTVFIPSDIVEQKTIAEILSKADEEIELLNKKLEAFKLEKKALMQQLLTGKIRVKVN